MVWLGSQIVHGLIIHYKNHCAKGHIKQIGEN